MAKWSVHISRGEALEKLGTVEAWDRPDAIASAILTFTIPYALQSQIVVTRAGLSGWFEQLRNSVSITSLSQLRLWLFGHACPATPANQA